MLKSEREIRTAIEGEVSRYAEVGLKVSFRDGNHGGIAVLTFGDDQRSVRYSRPVGAFEHIVRDVRADVRREIKRMGCMQAPPVAQVRAQNMRAQKPELVLAAAVEETQKTEKESMSLNGHRSGYSTHGRDMASSRDLGDEIDTTPRAPAPSPIATRPMTQTTSDPRPAHRDGSRDRRERAPRELPARTERQEHRERSERPARVGSFGAALRDAMGTAAEPIKAPTPEARLQTQSQPQSSSQPLAIRPAAEKTPAASSAGLAAAVDAVSAADDTGASVQLAQPGRKVQLTQQQVIRITLLLSKHGDVQNPEDEKTKTFVYADGWSDERIRDEVRKDAAIEKVAELRRENFAMTAVEHEGRRKRLDAGHGGPFSAHIQRAHDRISEQEEAIARLTAQLKAAIERIDILEEMVAPTS
jgi:hypothetical protein